MRTRASTRSSRSGSRSGRANSAATGGQAACKDASPQTCSFDVRDAFLACSYLAYISFARVRRGDVDWPRDVWSLVTYAIWVLLMAGLIGETRCRRERIFFTLILVNFTLGFVFAAWGNIPDAWARNAREIAAGLWALAAVVSGVLMFSSGRGLKRGAGRHV